MSTNLHKRFESAVEELKKRGYLIEKDTFKTNLWVVQQVDKIGRAKYLMTKREVIKLVRTNIGIWKEEDAMDRQAKYIAEHTCPTCGQSIPKGVLR